MASASASASSTEEAMDTSSPLDPGTLSHRALINEFKAWKAERDGGGGRSGAKIDLKKVRKERRSRGEKRIKARRGERDRGSRSVIGVKLRFRAFVRLIAPSIGALPFVDYFESKQRKHVGSHCFFIRT